MSIISYLLIEIFIKWCFYFVYYFFINKIWSYFFSFRLRRFGTRTWWYPACQRNFVVIFPFHFRLRRLATCTVRGGMRPARETLWSFFNFILGWDNWRRVHGGIRPAKETLRSFFIFILGWDDWRRIHGGIRPAREKWRQPRARDCQNVTWVRDFFKFRFLDCHIEGGRGYISDKNKRKLAEMPQAFLGNIFTRKNLLNIWKKFFRILERVKTFRIHHRPGEQLKLRIGIHTGVYQILLFV
jgi:hypothetical protein